MDIKLEPVRITFDPFPGWRFRFDGVSIRHEPIPQHALITEEAAAVAAETEYLRLRQEQLNRYVSGLPATDKTTPTQTFGHTPPLAINQAAIDARSNTWDKCCSKPINNSNCTLKPGHDGDCQPF